ncbi:hypothetical protein QTP70_000505 [Hemibagrus guttatus]|uniref:PiggyBac transposable element-derived protein domain-containing protein n=1 Tax=Hemibagrus guttatus TaxID=175788 RepID=A0AAE0QIG8_9TELE|nr:hypothetical protein QTP70_000505 [Hemibagrus guttatus]
MKMQCLRQGQRTQIAQRMYFRQGKQRQESQNFVVYQGKTTFRITAGWGIGEQAVPHVAKFIPKGTNLFFDRFFTTVDLLDTLMENGMAEIGTFTKKKISQNECNTTVHQTIKKKKGWASEMVVR